MKYNKLTVLGNEKREGKRMHLKVDCVCDCGMSCRKWLSDIKSGKTKSCGCYRREVTRLTGVKNTTHGHSASSPTYRSWYAMRKRCGQNGVYKNITYDLRWDSFPMFLEDMGERPEGTTLDRIDSDGDYSASNCRWSTKLQQTLNRKTTRWYIYDGEKICLKDLAARLNVTSTRLSSHLKKNNNNLDVVISDFENREAG